MYSLKYKYLFIRIPKTGSTTLRRWLYDIGGLYELETNDAHPHCSAQGYYERLGKDVFDRCFRFAIVRNPYERFVSEYWWRKNHWLLQFNEQEKCEEACLGINEVNVNDYAEPQCNLTHMDDRCQCTIYRYESGLENAMVKISKMIAANLDRLNINNNWQIIYSIQGRHNADTREDRRPYYEQMSSSMIEAVTTRYFMDFETFGYDIHR